MSACVCTSTSVITQVFVHVGTRGWHRSPHSLLDFLSQAFSLHWKLTSQLGQLFRKHHGCSCLCLSSLGIVHVPPLFLPWVLGAFTSGLHADTSLSDAPTNSWRAQPCVFTFNSSLENGSSYSISQFHVSFSFQTSFQLLHPTHHNQQTASCLCP